MKALLAPIPDWRAGALVVLLLASFAGVMALEPIAQSAAYHDFADRRFLLGVPNLLDVASTCWALLAATSTRRAIDRNAAAGLFQRAAR